MVKIVFELGFRLLIIPALLVFALLIFFLGIRLNQYPLIVKLPVIVFLGVFILLGFPIFLFRKSKNTYLEIAAWIFSLSVLFLGISIFTYTQLPDQKLLIINDRNESLFVESGNVINFGIKRPSEKVMVVSPLSGKFTIKKEKSEIKVKWSLSLAEERPDPQIVEKIPELIKEGVSLKKSGHSNLTIKPEVKTMLFENGYEIDKLKIIE